MHEQKKTEPLPKNQLSVQDIFQIGKFAAYLEMLSPDKQKELLAFMEGMKCGSTMCNETGKLT